MNMKTIVAIAAILVVLGAGYAVARPNGFWNSMMNGYGPAGNYGNYGGTVPGHCGAGYGTGYGNATPITIDKAKEAVEQYLAAAGNADLKLTEVMEFSNNFYADVEEKSTGMHAFELLVNRYTGIVTPEPGPNMMWNTKYSPMARMMGLNVQTQAAVTEKQALEYAQAYLDKVLPGAKADEADAFYGYYTVHVTKDGKLYGMLSVHGSTGAVWYHGWHGTFVKILEI